MFHPVVEYYGPFLKALDLDLSYRQNRGDLILMYKIVKN